MIELFLRIIRHLLPRARAWRIPVEPDTRYMITANAGSLWTCGDLQSTAGRLEYVKEIYRGAIAPARYLYKFFRGLAGLPAGIRTDADLVYFDTFPDDTRELEAWETQFNLTGAGTEAERRADLTSAWRAQGGQGLDYLQGLIWAAGFTNVYLHQWWTGTAVKNPFTYIDAPNNPLPGGGFLLVNKGPTIVSPVYDVYCLGPDSDCGSIEAECASIEGFQFLPVEYNLPTDPDTWPFFIYVGGQTFPNHATVPSARRIEFERLLLTYFPDQQWLGLLIDYV